MNGNYFILNKTSDYEGGYLKNAVYVNRGVEILNSASEGPGIFFSKLLDSGVGGNDWHRLRADLRMGDNMAVEVAVYTMDSEEGHRRIQELLRGERVEPDEKLKQTEGFCRCRFHNPEDVLLFEVSGRYLWLSVIMWGSHAGGPWIGNLQVFFPKRSWTSYLPEIYQGRKGSFTDRFLGIFQTIYEELETDIRNNPAMLDIAAAEDRMVIWLAEWMDMDNSFSWRTDRLRLYLADGAAVFADRGTKRGLKHMVRMYTGAMPYLVEPEERSGEFLLLISQSAVPSPKEYQALLRVIREGKPAHMKVRLIVLRPFVFLNRNTYLGVNSCLNRYSQAAFNGSSELGLVRLGGEME